MAKKLNITTVGEATFEEVIAKSTPDIQEIARAARVLIAEVYPGVTEVPWAKQANIGYGIGPKKMSEHFAYIMPHSDYVNLGFMYGADLDDPDGLLEGAGKLLRHIKLRSVKEARRPAVKKLLKVASHYLPKAS